ncbi:unnamed protein product [Prorocentrum cordatum]|uniref:Uncharacterized protein n=1 Tax=Prorocentrum cordatum TaxID=2364126 RepID=A0ABN9YEK8_9DINO|nr:unnamed protein product [Polarella glacialis]
MVRHPRGQGRWRPEAWADITPEATQRWWRSLSPVLLSFRERCLSTEGYWRLLTQGGWTLLASTREEEEAEAARAGDRHESAHLASAVGSREDGGNLTAPSAAPARPVA